MQEDIEQKSLTLSINTVKFTGRTLKNAITKYLAHLKDQKRGRQNGAVSYRGKQTVKQLVSQNQGVSNLELNDSHIKDFERIARKYGVDFAIKKTGTKDNYLVFFKARDADALTAAFTEYSKKRVHRKEEKPSLLASLKLLKSKTPSKNAEQVKNKKPEVTR